MSTTYIDYNKITDKYMYLAVKDILESAMRDGITGDHHFYISFLTQFSGVLLSTKLKHRYPNEMTIVLQYQFEDLKVFDNYFSVKLSFDGVKETIVIPFNALTTFADPSVKFILPFKYQEYNTEVVEFDTDDTIDLLTDKKNNIINLDKFRHRNKQK